MTDRPDFIAELEWRGLFNQCTDVQGLRRHLLTADLARGGRRAYIGFDPTADSLTIGNLVQIMVLAHFQRAGHTPIALLGGATGQIGDPSGKSAERMLSDPAEVARRLDRQRHIFDRVLRVGGVNGVRMVNNDEWWKPKSYIEVLRDIGKHFSVNMMIQKDSVRERLHNRDQGISYTEFSYMILQAYDFYELWKNFAMHGLSEPVTLQMGGSDQWGNIVAGADLIGRTQVRVLSSCIQAQDRLLSAIRNGPDSKPKTLLASVDIQAGSTPRQHGVGVGHDIQPVLDSVRAEGTHEQTELLRELEACEAQIGPDRFGLTVPLLMKADGGKFGKSEKGAIWLSAPKPGDTSPNRTTPYALDQYLLNLADADVGKFLRIFTTAPDPADPLGWRFLTQPEVLDIEARHAADPGQRLAQRTVAESMVRLLHGAHEAESAQRAAAALFSGDIASLPEATLREVLADAPASTMPRDRLAAGVDLIDVLTETGLAASRKQAKEFLATGAVTINGRPAPADHRVTTEHTLHGRLTAIRRGKKNWHLVEWR